MKNVSKLKYSLIQRVWKCEMPSIDLRGAICDLINQYHDLCKMCLEIKTGLDIDSVRILAVKSRTIEDKLNKLLPEENMGSVCCRLIELGERDFLSCGLDFEPDQIDIEDEDDCCEICGNSREGFTENLCEECFDNEIDKHYDGGIDEDE